MAELVQQAMEDMVPELEQLQRTQLFSPEEVSRLKQKRQRSEYLLQKRQKRKEDFLNYAQDELAVLDLIAARREAMDFKKKKDKIDYAVARRITKLFRVLEHRFPDDRRIWVSHAAFLERMGWDGDVGKTYRAALRFHALEPEMWIRAARYEWMAERREDEEGLSKREVRRRRKTSKWENARKLMLEGRRFNPQSADMIREVSRTLMPAGKVFVVNPNLSHSSTSTWSYHAGSTC